MCVCVCEWWERWVRELCKVLRRFLDLPSESIGSFNLNLTVYRILSVHLLSLFLLKQTIWYDGSFSWLMSECEWVSLILKKIFKILKFFGFFATVFFSIYVITPFINICVIMMMMRRQQKKENIILLHITRHQPHSPLSLPKKRNLKKSQTSTPLNIHCVTVFQFSLNPRSHTRSLFATRGIQNSCNFWGCVVKHLMRVQSESVPILCSVCFFRLSHSRKSELSPNWRSCHLFLHITTTNRGLLVKKFLEVDR